MGNLNLLGEGTCPGFGVYGSGFRDLSHSWYLRIYVTMYVCRSQFVLLALRIRILLACALIGGGGGGGGGAFCHLHDKRLQIRAAFSRARPRNAHGTRDRLATHVRNHAHVHAQPVERIHARARQARSGQVNQLTRNRRRRFRVVGIHMAAHGTGERLHGVGTRGGVVGHGNAPCSPKSADEPARARHLRGKPAKVSKIHPECVGVRLQVNLPRRRRGVALELRRLARQARARVADAREPARHHHQAAPRVALEVARVAAKAREREDRTPFVVERDARDGTRGPEAPFLFFVTRGCCRIARAQHGKLREAGERAHFLRHRKARRLLLVRVVRR